MMDEESLCIREELLDVSQRLDNADLHLSVPKDIFLFIEKAYWDSYEYVKIVGVHSSRVIFIVRNAMVISTIPKLQNSFPLV